LFFCDFFVISVSNIIGVRINIFVCVELFGFAVFLNVFVIFGVGCLLLSFFSFEQGELIFVGYLVIIRVDFAKGKEAMAITAIFYEGCL